MPDIKVTAPSGGTAAPPNIQRSSVSGAFTWTKPAGTTATSRYHARLVGGGSGGGSGRKGAAGTSRYGGTGGAGAEIVEIEGLVSTLAASIAGTVGAKGIGGAAVAANSTNGAAGTAGGDTTWNGMTARGVSTSGTTVGKAGSNSGVDGGVAPYSPTSETTTQGNVGADGYAGDNYLPDDQHHGPLPVKYNAGCGGEGRSITTPANFAKAFVSASATDGSTIFIVAGQGTYPSLILKSANSGVDWTEIRIAADYLCKNSISGSLPYSCVAVSDDGSIIVVCSKSTTTNCGRVYRSADGGATWSEIRPAGDVDKNWQCVSMTGDGTGILIGINSGRLWYSSDSGSTWTEQTPAGASDKAWQCCSVSRTDASVRLAAVSSGRVYMYSGGSWAETQPAGANNRSWTCCSMCNDGSVMMIGCTSTNGRLYVYSGAAWAEATPAGAADKNWTTCAVSGTDGSVRIAGINLGRLWLYKAAAWAEATPAGASDKAWQCSTMDNDGSVICCGVNYLVAIPSRLYKTVDTGVNWAEPTSETWIASSGSGGSTNVSFAAGGAKGSPGANGTDNANNLGGGGGGGGDAEGQAGGNGGQWGAGGGGGAYGTNAVANSGKGGDGADGLIEVITYF